jgi:preprotein translocase subunit Sec61beta
MADSKFNLPGGYGGLVRYSEEYESKLKLKPEHVIVLIVAVIVFVVCLKIFLPISA